MTHANEIIQPIVPERSGAVFAGGDRTSTRTSDGMNHE